MRARRDVRCGLPLPAATTPADSVVGCSRPRDLPSKGGIYKPYEPDADKVRLLPAWRRRADLLVLRPASIGSELLSVVWRRWAAGDAGTEAPHVAAMGRRVLFPKCALPGDSTCRRNLSGQPEKCCISLTRHDEEYRRRWRCRAAGGAGAGLPQSCIGAPGSYLTAQSEVPRLLGRFALSCGPSPKEGSDPPFSGCRFRAFPAVPERLRGRCFPYAAPAAVDRERRALPRDRRERERSHLDGRPRGSPHERERRLRARPRVVSGRAARPAAGRPGRARVPPSASG